MSTKKPREQGALSAWSDDFQLQIQGDRGSGQITCWIGMRDAPPNGPAVAYLNITDHRGCFGSRGTFCLRSDEVSTM